MKKHKKHSDLSLIFTETKFECGEWYSFDKGTKSKNSVHGRFRVVENEEGEKREYRKSRQWGNNSWEVTKDVFVETVPPSIVVCGPDVDRRGEPVRRQAFGISFDEYANLLAKRKGQGVIDLRPIQAKHMKKWVTPKAKPA
jgi:hypothetical protein